MENSPIITLDHVSAAYDGLTVLDDAQKLVRRLEPDFNVETVPVDGKTFQASVLVTASKPFFGWVFGFDGKVRITAPAKVKKEYTKMLKKALEQD